MFKFIIPTILITISIALFFTFISPIYKDLSSLRKQVASYNEALDNSKALENERDKLTSKYNSIGNENLNKLQKLLPGSVDNIRLILEIEKLALPYGMTLKDVQYDSSTSDTSSNSSGVIQSDSTTSDLNKDYDVWTLGFSSEGSYNNFLNFVKDLESNLRIVDVVSVGFSSGTDKSDVYKYDFSIKTYWLKK